MVSDSALTQAIRTIRRALDDDPREPRFIRTVSRHGYRFVCADTVEEEDVATGAGHQPPAGAGRAIRARPARAPRGPLAEPSAVTTTKAARRGRGAPPDGHGRGAGAARRAAGPRAGARLSARLALGRARARRAVPLFGAPGAARDAAILFGLRLRRARRLAGERWLTAAFGGAAAGLLAGVLGGAVLWLGPGSRMTPTVPIVLGLLGMASAGPGRRASARAWRRRRCWCDRGAACRSRSCGGAGRRPRGRPRPPRRQWTVAGAVRPRHVARSAAGSRGSSWAAPSASGYALGDAAARGRHGRAGRGATRLRVALMTGLAGALAALALAATGSHLGAMSLDFMARSFPGSQLTFVPIARLLGESAPGLVTRLVIGAGEGPASARAWPSASRTARASAGQPLLTRRSQLAHHARRLPAQLMSGGRRAAARKRGSMSTGPRGPGRPWPTVATPSPCGPSAPAVHRRDGARGRARPPVRHPRRAWSRSRSATRRPPSWSTRTSRCCSGDFWALLDRLCPPDIAYGHDDMDRRRTRVAGRAAERRVPLPQALLLGSGQTLHVSGGALQLGRWQRILLVELDGPRTPHAVDRGRRAAGRAMRTREPRRAGAAARRARAGRLRRPDARRPVRPRHRPGHRRLRSARLVATHREELDRGRLAAAAAALTAAVGLAWRDSPTLHALDVVLLLAVLRPARDRTTRARVAVGLAHRVVRSAVLVAFGGRRPARTHPVERRAERALLAASLRRALRGPAGGLPVVLIFTRSCSRTPTPSSDSASSRLFSFELGELIAPRDRRAPPCPGSPRACCTPGSPHGPGALPARPAWLGAGRASRSRSSWPSSTCCSAASSGCRSATCSAAASGSTPSPGSRTRSTRGAASSSSSTVTALALPLLLVAHWLVRPDARGRPASCWRSPASRSRCVLVMLASALERMRLYQAAVRPDRAALLHDRVHALAGGAARVVPADGAARAGATSSRTRPCCRPGSRSSCLHAVNPDERIVIANRDGAERLRRRRTRSRCARTRCLRSSTRRSHPRRGRSWPGASSTAGRRRKATSGAGASRARMPDAPSRRLV